MLTVLSSNNKNKHQRRRRRLKSQMQSSLPANMARNTCHSQSVCESVYLSVFLTMCLYLFVYVRWQLSCILPFFRQSKCSYKWQMVAAAKGRRWSITASYDRLKCNKCQSKRSVFQFDKLFSNLLDLSESFNSTEYFLVQHLQAKLLLFLGKLLFVCLFLDPVL